MSLKSRTRAFILIVFVISIAAISVFKRPKFQRATLPTAPMAKVLGFIEHQSKQLQALPIVLEEGSASWVQKTKIAFTAMHDLYNYVEKDKIRRELMDELYGFYFGLMGRVQDQEAMRQKILWHIR